MVLLALAIGDPGRTIQRDPVVCFRHSGKVHLESCSLIYRQAKDVLSGFSPCFSVQRSGFGVFCCHESRYKGERSYQASDNTQPPSGISSATRSISRIPLGAKIGATSIIATLAFGILFVGLGRVLNGGRDTIKGLALLGCGIGLWVASAIPWLASS